MRTYLVICTIVSVLAACSGDDLPPNIDHDCNDISLCDTCDSKRPLANLDDSMSVAMYHLAVFGVSKAPGLQLYAGIVHTFIGSMNIFFFRTSSPATIGLIGGASVAWSENGKYLATIYGAYDVNDTRYISDELPPNAKNPQWVFNDSAITFELGNDIYISTIVDSRYQKFISNFPGGRQLSDSIFIAFVHNRIVECNIRTGEQRDLVFSILPGQLELLNEDENHTARRGSWDLSPDREKVLVDIGINQQGSIINTEGGVYLFDLKRRTFRKVLPVQYYGQPFFPRWSSNTTFIGSWFCRKENSSMAYEFDLDGKSIGQITFSNQKFWP